MDQTFYSRSLAIQLLTCMIVIILLVDRLSTNNSSAVSSAAVPLERPLLQGMDTRQPAVQNIDWSKDYVYGAADAPNFMIVYASYNCGVCGYFYERVFDSLVESHVKTGALKIISKDLVDTGNASDYLKARLAEVARQTGRFEPVHKTLVRHRELTDSASLVRLVMTAGVPEADLKKRLNSTETLRKIDEDNQSAKQLNIMGTPSFVINGKVYIGYLPYKDIVANL